MIIKNAWFKFNGVDSRQMGIIVTAMPPTVRPARRIGSVTIAGRNGSLHTDEGVYDSYSRSMECAVINRERIDEIAAWLVGNGEIVFSTEPDKVYHVMISNKIDISAMMRTFQKFRVTLDTQPFKYSVNAFNDTIELEGDRAETVIHNKGTVYSDPTITVYGSGTVRLIINDTEITLRDIDGYITINSEMMEVYRGDASQNSKYGAMDFPRLEPGENSISWTGNVEEIVIEPKWRWL